MKIKNIKIYFVKKKKFQSIYPRPSYFKNGFVFFKLICENNVEGYGEPSPYINKNNIVIKNIEKIYNKYFKNKSINLNYVNKIKKIVLNNQIKKILPAFEQAIFDINAKYKKTNVSSLINKKNAKYLRFYASGGMLFENQSYDLILNEALKAKSLGFYGYKFRPNLPLQNLDHFQRMKKPPRINIKNLEKFSSKLRLNVGPKFKIMIDLGCRIQTNVEADYLFSIFNEHNYFFVEEPFMRKIDYYNNSNFLKKGVKIAGGEHISSFEDFKIWKKKNCFDFYQPDSNLLLYKELNQISNLVGQDRIILHNWCNKINFLSNINFAFTQTKNIILEKNILQNPYDEFFSYETIKINKGKIYFEKNNGLGISINKRKEKNFEIYKKKI